MGGWSARSGLTSAPPPLRTYPPIYIPRHVARALGRRALERNWTRANKQSLYFGSANIIITDRGGVNRVIGRTIGGRLRRFRQRQNQHRSAAPFCTRLLMAVYRENDPSLISL